MRTNIIQNNFFPVSFVAVGLFLLAGCGSSTPRPAGFPDTVSCVITITQEGSPLAGASVSLIPADGAKDWLFGATTDTSGNAKIFTYGTAEGAPRGKYKVVVTKTESESSKFTMPDESDTVALAQYYRNIENERLNSYTLIEPVYTNADTTPLELEITGKTTETFDVGKKVRNLIPAH